MANTKDIEKGQRVWALHEEYDKWVVESGLLKGKVNKRDGRDERYVVDFESGELLLTTMDNIFPTKQEAEWAKNHRN